MSASPLKADILLRLGGVSLVPQADIQPVPNGRTIAVPFTLGLRRGELPELALQTVEIDWLGDELGGAVVTRQGRARRRDGGSRPYLAAAAAAPAMAHGLLGRSSRPRRRWRRGSCRR